MAYLTAKYQNLVGRRLDVSHDRARVIIFFQWDSIKPFWFCRPSGAPDTWVVRRILSRISGDSRYAEIDPPISLKSLSALMIVGLHPRSLMNDFMACRRDGDVRVLRPYSYRCDVDLSIRTST